VKDGRIYFPTDEANDLEEEKEGTGLHSGSIIENTIGYARELETIV